MEPQAAYPSTFSGEDQTFMSTPPVTLESPKPPQGRVGNVLEYLRLDVLAQRLGITDTGTILLTVVACNFVGDSVVGPITVYTINVLAMMLAGSLKLQSPSRLCVFARRDWLRGLSGFPTFCAEALVFGVDCLRQRDGGTRLVRAHARPPGRAPWGRAPRPSAYDV
jgi:hypothetical protein